MKLNMVWGLLYWDSSTNTMKVGKFTKESGLRTEDGNSTVNIANVIFAKFGGAVGFTHTGDSWDATDIKFDPRTTKTTTWTAIPAFNQNSSWVDGYISRDPDYHHGTNVKAGRGDICKLAEMTAASVSTTNYDNKRWRLPTNAENIAIAGNIESFYFDDTVTPNIMTFTTDYMLPALGWRTPSVGAPEKWGKQGDYWSSQPDGSNGYFLSFYYTTIAYVSPSVSHDPHYGFATRCIPQD